MSPVGVKVPADCAITIGALLATPKKRSGITRLVFMSRLDSQRLSRCEKGFARSQCTPWCCWVSGRVQTLPVRVTGPAWPETILSGQARLILLYYAAAGVASRARVLR